MKTILFYLLLTSISFADYKEYKLSDDVIKSYNKLLKSMSELNHYIFNRINELELKKNRTLQEEDELNALRIIESGDANKINNYLHNRKVKIKPKLSH